MRSLAGSTSWPIVGRAPLTVTRRRRPAPPLARRDATPASASTFWMRTRRHSSRRDLTRGAAAASGSSVRQVLQRCQPEALQEVEAGAVQDRPAGRVRAALLHDQPPMQQAAHHVVGVDAADALDDAARDRLAIGDDRQRLERRGRQADALGADVSRDQRPGLGRGRELDLLARRRPAGRRDRAAPPPGRPAARRRRPGRCRRACAISRRRQRPLGDEQQRLELRDAQLDRVRRCQDVDRSLRLVGVPSASVGGARIVRRSSGLVGIGGRGSAPTARPARRPPRVPWPAPASPGTSRRRRPGRVTSRSSSWSTTAAPRAAPRG